MRTALCIVIGLTAVVGGAPASLAKDSRVADPGKPAGRPGSKAGISLAVPVGRISVVPGGGPGQPVYVRRTVKEGITVVEVSSAPFEPVLASNAALPAVRPDQPAGW